MQHNLQKIYKKLHLTILSKNTDLKSYFNFRIDPFDPIDFDPTLHFAHISNLRVKNFCEIAMK
jgi:hypothetical protein